MRTAWVAGGKCALLIGLPLGYLGLCWRYAPPWWLTLAGYAVCRRLWYSLAGVFVEQAVKKYGTL